jgi:hypothetical protein
LRANQIWRISSKVKTLSLFISNVIKKQYLRPNSKLFSKNCIKDKEFLALIEFKNRDVFYVIKSNTKFKSNAFAQTECCCSGRKGAIITVYVLLL